MVSNDDNWSIISNVAYPWGQSQFNKPALPSNVSIAIVEPSKSILPSMQFHSSSCLSTHRISILALVSSRSVKNKAHVVGNIGNALNAVCFNSASVGLRRRLYIVGASLKFGMSLNVFNDVLMFEQHAVVISNANVDMLKKFQEKFHGMKNFEN